MRLSRPRRSFSTRGSYSIVQAKVLSQLMRGNGCLPILQPGFGHMPILGLFKMIDENVPNELAKGNTRRLCFGQQSGFDLLRNVDGDSHMPVFSQIGAVKNFTPEPRGTDGLVESLLGSVWTILP